MTSWLQAISDIDTLRDYIRIGREQVFDNSLASIESFEPESGGLIGAV